MADWLSNPDLHTVLQIHFSTPDYQKFMRLLQAEKRNAALLKGGIIRVFSQEEQQQLDRLKKLAGEALAKWERDSYGQLSEVEE